MFANVFNSLKKFLLWCASPRRLKVHQLSAVLLSLTVCVPAPMHKSAKSSCVNDKRIKLTGDWCILSQGSFNSHRKGLDPMLATAPFSVFCVCHHQQDEQQGMIDRMVGTPLASRCMQQVHCSAHCSTAKCLLILVAVQLNEFLLHLCSGNNFREGFLLPSWLCKPFPAKSLNEENSIWIAHKG